MENIYQGDVAELELILPRLNIRLLTPQLLRSSSATLDIHFGRVSFKQRSNENYPSEL